MVLDIFKRASDITFGKYKKPKKEKNSFIDFEKALL
jgi:hypothetical protein